MSLPEFSFAEVLAFVGALIALIGGYVRLQMASKQNAHNVNDALRAAREARDEVTSLKLEMAEKYASVAHLKEVEARLAVSIDRLSDRIDALLTKMG